MVKVLYEKMPPKSRTGKRPGGFLFDYKWEHIVKIIQETRDKAQLNSMGVSMFRPGEAEITQVIVGDEGVTFYLEPKVR